MPKSELKTILLRLISPDPSQPRKELGDLTGLVESIKEHGVIQPIIVSKGETGYVILAGERRYNAAKLADLKSIPCVVRTVDEHRRMEIQLIENLHRKGLSAFEEAEAYKSLIEEHNLSQAAIAQDVSVSEATIAQTLRLLTLPKKIQTEARGTDVPKSILLEIAKSEVKSQRRMWRLAKTGGLTVKKARQLKKGVEPQLTFRETIRVEGCDVFLVFHRPKATKRDIRRVLNACMQKLESNESPSSKSG